MAPWKSPLGLARGGVASRGRHGNPRFLRTDAPPRAKNLETEQAIQRALADHDRLIEERPLATALADPANAGRLHQLVAGSLLSAGDETQATPALRRHTPERAAGRRDAGAGPRLELVGGGVVIDATDRFNARRRNHFNNGSAA